MNHIDRRLAAIAAADVAGFTRLMEADEVGTLTRLKKIINEIVQPTTDEFHGRIFKDTGDGFLAEFRSVVDAIQWAAAVQSSIGALQAENAPERRLDFRLGVNVGDVIVQGDDLFGDGVNVAARLQTLARPRGICISDDVYRQVRNKLDLAYEDIGEQQIKNVSDPIRAYLVDPDATAVQLPAAPHGDRRPSIAVLPFKNLSGDPDQDYFGDGITEDLITALSKIPDLFVLSGHSTFTYKESARSATQVGRALGAKYVIEGSVRRANDRVRITAQLLDGETGKTHWAERYDRTLDDIFAVQDDVTGQIVAALELKFSGPAQVRKVDPRAYDLTLRARDLMSHMERKTNEEARRMLQEALSLEPDLAQAEAAMASTYMREVNQVWVSDAKPALANARAHAERAVAIDPDLPVAHETLGYVVLWMDSAEQALAHIQRAVEIDPNYADGYASLSEVYCWTGDFDKCIELVNRAMTLNPHYPVWYLGLLGFACFGKRDYEATIDISKRCLARNPDFAGSYLGLIASLGHLDRAEEARDAVAEARRHTALRTPEEIFAASPFADTEMREHFVEGLRRAGL